MSNLEDQKNQANGIKECQWTDCSARFTEFEELFNHLKESHVKDQNPALPRDCRWASKCTYQTSEKKHLISHLRSHLDWRPFPCDLCDGRFKHEHEIRRHKDRIHGVKNQENGFSQNQITPPPPLMNSGFSNSLSPTHHTSLSNLYTPDINSENDQILTCIIEYALGHRQNVEITEAFKNQLTYMGLPLSILTVPQSQLKRCLLDSFYQNMILLSNPIPSSNFDMNHLSPELYNQNGYTASQQQPLIDSINFSSENAGYNYNMGFNFNGQNQQNPVLPNFNFPTPPNNFQGYNSFGMQEQNNLKLDPNFVDFYNTNLFAQAQTGSRSLSSDRSPIKKESSSPTPSNFATRSINEQPRPTPTTNGKNEHSPSPSFKSQSSDSKESSFMKSFIPNVMNLLKIPSKSQSPPESPKDRSVSPQTPEAPKETPLSYQASRNINQKVDSTITVSVSPTHKLPFIRQEDGSYSIYTPKVSIPPNFSRLSPETGNEPLSPEEYLTLSMSGLRI